MDAKIANSNEGVAIAVQVFDNNSTDHRLLIDWETGDIDLHQQNRFPLEQSDRTEFQETVIQQVRARARFEAHYEVPEADFLERDGRPEHYERAIEAVESMSDARFRDLFATYHEAVSEDPRLSDAARRAVALDDIGTVYLPARLAPDRPAIEAVAEPFFDSLPDGEERQFHGPEPDFESNLVFQHYLVAEPIGFPDAFRDLLVRHLECHIRDIYLNMGTEPPAAYDVAGMGKLRIHGRDTIGGEYTTG
jgi:hypothetical protein